ncbi:MAG TPA: hypothetical protein VLE72_01730 [Candidatus Saccharimonadales bacterium]|nr:hypothetical protein [Candidatus Saccharimonadales bacterium]
MIWGLLLVLLAGFALLAVVTRGRSKPRSGGVSRGTIDYDLVRARWQTIEQMATESGSGLRNAVSEADKLLDYALKQLGTPGETMAERLKRVEGRLSHKEDVWQAHKLRNHLAHEVSFDLVASHAKGALAAFGQALRDLGALR